MKSKNNKNNIIIFIKTVIIDVFLVITIFFSLNLMFPQFMENIFSNKVVYKTIENKHNQIIIDNKCPIHYENILKDIEFLTYHEVKYGESIYSLLDDFEHLSNKDIYNIIQNIKNLNQNYIHLKNAQNYRKRFINNKIHSIDLFLSDLNYIQINLNNNFLIKEKIIEPTTKYKTISGTINSSLYINGIEAGLTEKTIQELVDIFAWDIDFNRDIQQGNKFSVLFEELYDDKRFIGYGKIKAASINIQRGVFYAYSYYDENVLNYYNEEGNNLQKQFLKSPVEINRVTSKFTYKRWHPILKINRPHRGVDYGGSLNTPIMATADGKIIKRKKERAYGNVIVIDHGRGYKTLYAHMNKFNKKYKIGDNVRQGDIIGYMGTTGLSTGVHLHYELRLNDKHKDPLTIDLPDGKSVSDLDHFKKEMKFLKSMLNKKEA